MKLIGLTGKTGAGKSTVASLLAKEGFFIIDGDELAAEVTRRGSPVLDELAAAFGGDIIDENGELRRSLLAERAFSSEEKRLLLNSITHGAIDRELSKKLEEGEKNGYEYAIFDAAALLESPSRKRCEKIILVTADRETRFRRILERDGLSAEEADRRIDAQKSDKYYLENSDCVLENDGEGLLSDKVKAITEIIIL